MVEFFHSFNRSSLSSYYVPGSVLGLDMWQEANPRLYPHGVFIQVANTGNNYVNV